MVRITVKVSEETAAAVTQDPDLLFINIPLDQTSLSLGENRVGGKFVEYETMIAEVLDN